MVSFHHFLKKAKMKTLENQIPWFGGMFLVGKQKKSKVMFSKKCETAFSVKREGEQSVA